MKKIFVFVPLLLLTFLVKAQVEPMFTKGDKLVNVGLGLGYYRYYSMAIDLSASLDYCIADNVIDNGSIGIGPFVGTGFVWGGLQPYAGFRGTFHYPFIEKLDTYFGFGMGFRKYSSLHLIGGFFLGANYPLDEKFTIFGEFGSGNTNIGLCFRLK